MLGFLGNNIVTLITSSLNLVYSKVVVCDKWEKVEKKGVVSGYLCYRLHSSSVHWLSLSVMVCFNVFCCKFNSFINSNKPQVIIYDRVGSGNKNIKEILITTPVKTLKRNSACAKRVKRKKFRRRAAIKPVIEHMMNHFRMKQNYLHGYKPLYINALLVTAG